MLLSCAVRWAFILTFQSSNSSFENMGTLLKNAIAFAVDVSERDNHLWYHLLELVECLKEELNKNSNNPNNNLIKKSIVCVLIVCTKAQYWKTILSSFIIGKTSIYFFWNSYILMLIELIFDLTQSSIYIIGR